MGMPTSLGNREGYGLHWSRPQSSECAVIAHFGGYSQFFEVADIHCKFSMARVREQLKSVTFASYVIWKTL